MDAAFVPLVRAFTARHDDISFDAHKTFIMESCHLLVEACGTVRRLEMKQKEGHS
jgi:hypothetical protein